MRISSWFLSCGPLVATVLGCWAEPLGAQEMVELSSVRVQDEGGRGVVSMVYRETYLGEMIPLRGRTGQDGRLDFDPPVACEIDERIVAVPESYMRYEAIPPGDVQTTVEFVARLRFGWEGDWSHQHSVPGSTGRRLLFYTQEAGTARLENSESAVYAEQWAYVSAAELLNVEVAMRFDEEQQRIVASEELLASVEDHQRRRGLSVTRKLDSETVTTLAGAPFWSVIYDVDSEAAISRTAPRLVLAEDFLQRVEALGDAELQVLTLNATQARAQGESGIASLLFSDATVRLRAAEGDAAQHLGDITEFEMFKSMGDALAVESPTYYDPVQGKYVMSVTLSDELVKFQERMGLEATGIPSYGSLRSLAGGRDVGHYLTGVRFVE